jgi:hypothetical protein
MRSTGRREPLPTEDRQDVMLWRCRRLQDAGFDPAHAAALARNCAYDLHAILDLVDRGCPAELAVRILAPLDEKRRPC